MNTRITDILIGITIGSALGMTFGYIWGYQAQRSVWKEPEFKFIIASVIVTIWALAYILSFITGSEVDSWLNTIMGIVVGFFFGDGIAEKLKKQ